MRKPSIRVLASALGIFAGLGGASHGPGEILQGNVAPNGVIIKAWPGLSSLNGEPAMTIAPSFLVTGILAIIFGIIVAVWAGAFVHRRYGGLLLVLLSITMLLVGGGIVPPLLGIVAGVVGTQWAAAFVQRKYGGLTLILLSTIFVISATMLLTTVLEA